MKILSLSSVFPNPAEPGLGLFVESRLRHLTEFAEVKVLAPVPLLDYSNPKGNLYRGPAHPVRNSGALEIHHPRWLYPPMGTPVNIVAEFLRLFPLAASIRRHFHFDLIDAHFCYPEGCTAALLAGAFGVPFTVTLRGSETAFDAKPSRRRAIEFALCRAAAVITVSDELAAYALSRGAPSDRTFTIPNGIDTATFWYRGKEAMRQKHGIRGGRKLIISAGELIEAKGHHCVIEALRQVLAQGMDAELLVVGNKARGGRPYDTDLRALVYQHQLGERVRFAGWVDRTGLAELFSACDLFCLASYTEGWPNVVHEALASGAPAVVTRVGGVSRMIPSSNFGTIVPLHDQPALNRAVTEALQRSWDREAISAWGRARDWRRVAVEVRDVFAQVLGLPAQALAGSVSQKGPESSNEYVRN